ncbi:MAG TPA: polysaccharide biosynthesis tyrosine autokinase [Blastocatellia bacterium]|nr:polysaccharide biosynthesis tyrosine autokinase [Blastocatellia bacterium]
MSEENHEIEKVVIPDEISLQPAYPRAADYRAEGDYGYGYGHKEENVRVREVWRNIRKHKWLIITITVVITIVVAIEMYRTPSIYEASTMIEIGKEDPPPGKPGSFVFQVEDPMNVSLKTKIQALRSPAVYQAVVLKLGLDQNPKFFSVGAKKSVLDAIKLLGQRVSGRPARLDEDDTEEAISSAKSGLPLTPEDQARFEPYMDAVDGGLTVVPVMDTRDLKISFRHSDQKIAAAIANAIAEVFIKQNFEAKTQKFTTTSDWLDRSTRELKAKVQQAEQALANYTRENNIFSTEGKETLTADKLSRLHEQVMRAETDRMLKQSLYEEVKMGRVAQLPEAFADPKSSDLQKKLQELAITLSDLETKYGPENPQIVRVKQEIAVIQGQISESRSTLAERLKADYERAVRDEQSLKAALEKAKGEAVQQNQAAIQLNILKQDVDTANKLYTEFLQNTNQANLQVAEQHNNVRIISPARVPKTPISPARMRTVVIGFMLALSAGIGLAMFLEYIDNTIKTVEDVSRYVQLPALSVIPPIGLVAPRGMLPSKGAKKLKSLPASVNGNGAENANAAHLVAPDSRSSAAEAYRILRTSVLLSSAGKPPKTILVTSGQPGEGKTTTAVNTAISLSQLGASVLLIDCDMRKPSAHKILGIDNMRGLSTYLSRNMNVDGLIQKLQMPNLSFIPCGPIPPNPAELISSERMKRLLTELADRYDHVILDSPPLMNVTDPVILSTMVDGVLLVVHGGKSTRDVVRRARHDLDSVNAKVFGVVLNNVDLRREGYDNYYYYRYYSAYGQESTGDSAT